MIRTLTLFFALVFGGIVPQKTASIQQPAQSSAPLPVSWDTQKALIVSANKPVYPQIAVMAHIEGVVRIQFVVLADGTTGDWEYRSGPPLLMKAAIDSIKTWRFQSTMIDGKPVEIETTASVLFFLPGIDPEKVLAADRERVEKHPNDAKAHAELARQMYLMWMLDDSIKEYRQTVALQPNNAEYEFGLAKSLGDSGDTKAAIDEYRLVLSKKPRDTVAMHNLAEVLEASGDVDGAIAEYRRTEDDPQWKSDTELHLGQLLIKKGDTDGAIKELQHAVRQGFATPQVHYELGNAYLLRNDMKNAEKEYREASSAAPENRKYHEALDHVRQGAQH